MTVELTQKAATRFEIFFVVIVFDSKTTDDGTTNNKQQDFPSLNEECRSRVFA
jgi:hypothetical protein